MSAAIEDRVDAAGRGPRIAWVQRPVAALILGCLVGCTPSRRGDDLVGYGDASPWPARKAFSVIIVELSPHQAERPRLPFLLPDLAPHCPPGFVPAPSKRMEERLLAERRGTPVAWWTFDLLSRDQLFVDPPDAHEIRTILAVHPVRAEVTAVVTFCIDPHGKTYAVSTLTPIPGLPELDALLREEVDSWSFDFGKHRLAATRICSAYEFVVGVQ